MNKGRLYYHSLSQVLWGSPELNARVTVGVHRDTLRWACHASIYCELASCCLSSLVKGHGLSVLQICPAFLALFTSGHISAKNRNCTTEISSCRSISQLPRFYSFPRVPPEMSCVYPSCMSTPSYYPYVTIQPIIVSSTVWRRVSGRLSTKLHDVTPK